MAENPATWGRPETVIERTLIACAEAGEPEYGLSLPRRVADALRAAGLLLEHPGDAMPANYPLRCLHCGGQYALTLAGVFRLHRNHTTGRTCTGSHRSPGSTPGGAQ